MAAVLHDWLEDIDGATPELLEARFGPRVARLVQALSDSVGHPKPSWRERKVRYLEHLRHEVAEPMRTRFTPGRASTADDGDWRAAVGWSRSEETERPPWKCESE